ncbi:MAG: hypothetical protein U1B80_06295, partial [Anaerolineaceae bacterium]|nr:hypothetical protein [Anaerolineaceae bacterium]
MLQHANQIWRWNWVRFFLILTFVLPLAHNPMPAQAQSTTYEPVAPTPQRVFDLNPGAPGSFPNNFAVIGPTLFFRADDEDSGQELWKLSPPYT